MSAHREECEAIAAVSDVAYVYIGGDAVVLIYTHPVHGFRQIITDAHDPASWRKRCAELLSNKPQPWLSTDNDSSQELGHGS